MNRLSTRLAECRKSGRKAMGLFVTCGFPSLDATLPIVEAIDRGGADFIEIGMPFSDPLAEGKPIQHSSEVALARGTTLVDVISVTRSFREESDTPIVLMGYYNPILQYGIKRFCRDAAEAGVDGLILPDVPPDEASALREAANSVGLSLIFLVAPNTPKERVRYIESMSSGFVYAVSFAGLTGDSLELDGTVQRYLEGISEVVETPLMVGFGITDASDASKMSRHTDGFIVGSALIRLIDELWSNAGLSDEQRTSQITSFVTRLRPKTP